jgi:hypothetical protein
MGGAVSGVGYDGVFLRSGRRLRLPRGRGLSSGAVGGSGRVPVAAVALARAASIARVTARAPWNPRSRDAAARHCGPCAAASSRMKSVDWISRVASSSRQKSPVLMTLTRSSTMIRRHSMSLSSDNNRASAVGSLRKKRSSASMAACSPSPRMDALLRGGAAGQCRHRSARSAPYRDGALIHSTICSAPGAP